MAKRHETPITDGAFEVLSTRTFGAFLRYRQDKCRTRFGTLTWITVDLRDLDELAIPRVLAQDETPGDAYATRHHFARLSREADRADRGVL